jgi:hypothetical protein
MGDYTSQRALTLRLLTKFGKTVVLTRADDGAIYDPEGGSNSGGSTLNLNGVGVLLNFKRNEIDNTTVLATDRRLLFQGDSLEIGDKYNGWRVHMLDNLDPDESGTILTTAQMRK